MLYLTHSELLDRVSDIINQELSTAGKSFAEKRPGRTIRAAHSVANRLSKEHAWRHELWHFTGDGSTDFWRFDAPIHSVRYVLWNNVPMKSVPYTTHLESASRTIVPAIAFGYYYYVNDDGIGVGADLGSGQELTVAMNAWLPTLRTSTVALTQGDWTNGSTTVDNIVGATLAEGTNVDKGNALYGPDGRIYRIKSITDSDTVELTERYLGTTVTGTNGATTIGGHLALTPEWHNAVVYGAASELLDMEEQYDAAGKWGLKYEMAIEDALDVRRDMHESHFARG